MNCWILKTRPSQNAPFEKWIKPGKDVRWHTDKPIPDNFSADDRVVIWKSYPGMSVMALGYIKNPALPNDSDGTHRFIVAHTTGVIDTHIDIKFLRKLPLFDGASFLKAGAAGTIFPLSVPQGKYLFQEVEAKMRDADQTTENVRTKKLVRRSSESIERLERELADRVALSLRGSALKRKQRLAKAAKVPSSRSATIQIFDRSADVIAEVLEQAKGICGCCQKAAPFIRISNSTPYLEVHHKDPLAAGGKDTVANAIALCPNCHRNEHHGVARVK